MADTIQATGEITGGFYILNLGMVSMYLLRSGESCIAFDTGMRPDRLRAELKKVKIDPGTVSEVFLTHSDRDHVGGLSVFASAKVYLPEAEVAMIDHTTPRFFGFVYNKPIDRPYETVKDDQQLSIGSTFIRAIATPGHTAGHMSYLVNGSILISGDIVGLRDGKMAMDRKYINIDNTKRLDSIRRLASLSNITYLCTMHSGYTDKFELAAKEWK